MPLPGLNARLGKLADPQHWLDRAEELMTLADQSRDTETIWMLVRMAQDNLRLARQVESMFDDRPLRVVEG